MLRTETKWEVVPFYQHSSGKTTFAMAFLGQTKETDSLLYYSCAKFTDSHVSHPLWITKSLGVPGGGQAD